MSLELQGIRTVIYPAPDLPTATSWWTELLGVAPYFNQPFYVGFNVAGYELGLLPDADPTEGAIVYWGVDDVAVALSTATTSGARIHHELADVGDGITTGTVITPTGSVVGFINNPHFSLS